MAPDRTPRSPGRAAGGRRRPRRHRGNLRAERPATDRSGNEPASVRCCCSARVRPGRPARGHHRLGMFVRGEAAAQPRPVHQRAVDHQPRRGRVPPGDPRDAVRHRRGHPADRAARRRRRGLPRGVRRQDRWWNRLIELNIQNLAGVPSIVFGILGLAFIVRGPLSLGFVAAAGSLTLAPARAADGDPGRARGDPAVPPSIRTARWRSARPRGRPSAPGAARAGPGSSPASSSRSPGPSARPRRCCWSGR
jgi:hypothetical protein